MTRLKDRVALITGGSRGIGMATACKFSSEGAKIAIADIAMDRGRDKVAEINEAGGEVIAIRADVTIRTEVHAMIDQVLARYGHLDILVNCAGVSPKPPFLDIAESEWDQVIDVNLKGSFLCCQAAAPFMIKQRYGKVVNFASGAAYGSIYARAHYSSAKAGIMGLTRNLAVELGPHNINVNAVAPGFVESDMTRQSAKDLGLDFEVFKNTSAQRAALRRVAQPVDIANVVCFLVSEEASYVHGEIIHLSGGPSRGF